MLVKTFELKLVEIKMNPFLSNIFIGMPLLTLKFLKIILYTLLNLSKLIKNM